MSTFRLGLTSKLRLRGVHPDLVAVVERAIQLSDIDFTVVEGLRTRERQAELVKSGASKTLNSRHITGHAVDLAPLVAGKVSWHWPLFLELAPAMIAAARDLGTPIEWGGVWDRAATDLDEHNLPQELRAYCARHAGPDFLDGPHWQLSRSKYNEGNPT